MESMIAELVLSGNLYKRSDFVIIMCNRLDYNLLKHNELYEKLRKPDKGFWAKELIYEDYLLSKDKINNMIMQKELLFEQDYNFIVEQCEETGMSYKYLYFSTAGILKCISNRTSMYLKNIKYINMQYKYYLDELHSINIHINTVEL